MQNEYATVTRPDAVRTVWPCVRILHRSLPEFGKGFMLAVCVWVTWGVKIKRQADGRAIVSV